MSIWNNLNIVDTKYITGKGNIFYLELSKKPFVSKDLLKVKKDDVIVYKNKTYKVVNLEISRNLFNDNIGSKVGIIVK